MSREVLRSYDWKLGKGKAKAVFDISNAKLKEAQVPHRLLSALSSDFYKPFHLVSLHARLFPGRFFNPLSSPQVVHQAIKRLRETLRKEGLPLEILESRSVYRLSSSVPIQLRLSQKSRHDKLIGKEFSSLECARIWGLSHRTANRVIRQMIEAGRVVQIKKGPQARYTLSAASNTDYKSSKPSRFKG